MWGHGEDSRLHTKDRGPPKPTPPDSSNLDAWPPDLQGTDLPSLWCFAVAARAKTVFPGVTWCL